MIFFEDFVEKDGDWLGDGGGKVYYCKDGFGYVIFNLEVIVNIDRLRNNFIKDYCYVCVLVVSILRVMLFGLRWVCINENGWVDDGSNVVFEILVEYDGKGFVYDNVG